MGQPLCGVARGRDDTGQVRVPQGVRSRPDRYSSLRWDVKREDHRENRVVKVGSGPPETDLPQL